MYHTFLSISCPNDEAKRRNTGGPDSSRLNLGERASDLSESVLKFHRVSLPHSPAEV